MVFILASFLVLSDKSGLTEIMFLFYLFVLKISNDFLLIVVLYSISAISIEYVWHLWVRGE